MKANEKFRNLERQNVIGEVIYTGFHFEKIIVFDNN